MPYSSILDTIPMMEKNKKVLFSSPILFIFACMFFCSCNNEFSKKIPSLPDLNDAPKDLKDQIFTADQEARKKTSDDNLGKLGMIYFASNYYNRAGVCFDLAIKKEQEAWQWKYYRGLLHIELGESGKAAEQMKRVTEIQPNVWMAWYRLGDIYKQMDSTKLAEEALNKIISQQNKDTSIKNTLRTSYFSLQLFARLLLCENYMASNQNERAEIELKNLCYKHKTFGPAFRQLGILYASKNQTELSEKYKARANDLRVFNLPLDTLKDRLSLISKSESYVLKQIDDAMNGSDSKWSYELIQQARKNIPSSKYILSKAIRQYCSQGTGKLALPLLDQHFSVFKDDYDEVVQVGVILGDAGYKNEATKYLEQAMSFDSNTFEQKATLAGLFYEKAGMKARAVEIMSEVVKKNPNNIKILGDATFLMIQTGQLDKARSYYKRLKKIAPNDSCVKIYEGINAENSDNILHAISFFQQAFDANPKNKYLIKHITELMIARQMWEEGKLFFRKALFAFPNDSELQMYLGWLLVSYPNDMTNDIKEGIDFSERAFYNSRYQINNRVSAGRTLAIAYYQLGEKKKALQYINQTIGIALKANIETSYVEGLRSLSKQFSI
jgi:tetratricopeptide (TPR) repeat protein